MRTGRGTDRRLPRNLLGHGDRTGHQAQRHAQEHDVERRPRAAGVRHPLARHHRPEVEHADGNGRRGDHDASPEGFRTVGRRNRDAHQRLDHLRRDRHGLRLFDRQTAGSRTLLHQPDGSGLRGAGDRRAHAPERHHGQRHQGQAAHQHARFGVG